MLRLSPHLALLFLLFPLSSSCPTISCRDLPSNTCALIVSDAELAISTPGCASGYICSAEGLFAWFNQADTVAGATYPCSIDNTGVSRSERLSMKWPCYERLPSRNFASNTTVLSCASDKDCKLVDGTVTPGSCVCGLRATNSLGVCQPDYSSDLFQGYWDECDSDSGVVSDSVIGYYWFLYMRFYPLTKFDVPCATNLLEVKEFIVFRTEYSAAEWAAVAIAFIGI